MKNVRGDPPQGFQDYINQYAGLSLRAAPFRVVRFAVLSTRLVSSIKARCGSFAAFIA